VTTTGLVTHVNRIALLLALALFAALGAFWWRDRTRHYDTPRWPAASVAVLAPPDSGAAAERWIVAVNPDCAQCLRRLAELAGASLGVLLVDTPHRPDSLALGEGLAAGIWWDSLGVWRRAWGHRAYGETMVFGPGGALVRVLAPGDGAAPAAR
jgi:hypothetical protein